MEKWSLFFAALGLAMALEGMPYFVSPTSVRNVLRTLHEMGDGTLRLLGFLLMAGGLTVAYFATR